jgi:SanA protein
MRWLPRLVLPVVLVLVSAAAAFWGWVQWRAAQLTWTDFSAVPARPVAIVFGAGIRPDGSLTPMLRDRVDAAIDLYRVGKVKKLLFSGDNRFVDYDEPGRMYDYALAQGVPEEDMVRDYAGRRTYDTCYRASAIFGVRSAVLVTQAFHLPRALFTCRALGVEAVGLAAGGAYLSDPYYRLRDLAATLVAWWDVKVFRPLPVLGDPIDIGL